MADKKTQDSRKLEAKEVRSAIIQLAAGFGVALIQSDVVGKIARHHRGSLAQFWHRLDSENRLKVVSTEVGEVLSRFLTRLNNLNGRDLEKLDLGFQMLIERVWDSSSRTVEGRYDEDDWENPTDNRDWDTISGDFIIWAGCLDDAQLEKVVKWVNGEK